MLIPTVYMHIYICIGVYANMSCSQHCTVPFEGPLHSIATVYVTYKVIIRPKTLVNMMLANWIVFVI